MNPLSFLGALNPKVILATIILVATAAAVAVFGHVRYQAGVTDGTTTATAKFNVEKTTWLNEKAQAITTAVKAVQDRLDEAQRRIEAQNGVIEDAKQQATKALAAVAAGQRERAGLRDQLAQFVATSTGGGSGCGNPGAAAGGTATGDVQLLAGMLGEMADFAGQAAADADSARIAGLACQRSYDSLKASALPAAASAASAP